MVFRFASWVFFFFISLAFAGTQQWPVDDSELPPFTFIGKVSPAEKQLAAKLHESMRQGLIYWRDQGLPNPPDLDTLVYIGDVSKLRLREMLQLLNTRIPDAYEHLLKQYDFYRRSTLWIALGKLAPVLHIKAHILRRQAFEMYANIRYGLVTEDFVEKLKANVTYEEANVPDSFPKSDNAYYVQLPKVDLTEVLHECQNCSDENFDYNTLVDIPKLTEALEAEKSPRIVVLPRTTQTVNDLEVTTLQDASVLRHELGHHKIGKLSTSHITVHGSSQMHRLVNEAFADYMAASPVNNPKIGEFFAKASLIVAQRLRDKTASIDDQRLAEALQRLGERGVLRDLTDIFDMDDVSRNFVIANDYDAGHPLRTFIWKLRNRVPEEKRNQLEKLVLDSLISFSDLPGLISNRTQLVLWGREALNMLHKYVRTRFNYWKLKFWARWKNEQVTEEDLEYQAAKLTSTLFYELSKSSTARRRFWQHLGLGSRDSIQADYVVPEFLKAMYREASKLGDPEISSIIEQESGSAMNSKVVVVETQSGSNEISFLRNSLNKINFVARWRTNKLMGRMEEQRLAINLLETEYKAAKHRAKQDPQRWTPEMERIESDIERVSSSYRWNMEAIQEYERTGSTYRLWVPRPVMSLLSLVFAPFSKLMSMFGNRESIFSETSPVHQLCRAYLAP
ncbi:MAG: hypothetical protein AB7F43_07635 [Bacteriovoracia bacterium]